MTTPIAYSLADAASTTGIGVSKLRLAIRNGDLAARYNGAKPIIEHAELVAYVHSLSSERPSVRGVA